VTEVWTGFQTMTAAECRRLLGTTPIGRLAITAGALPVVLPVEYVVSGPDLLVRTPGHHEVSDGIDGQVVGFEADQLEPDQGVGWCVSVTGTVRVVEGDGGFEPVHPWFSDGLVLSLTTDVIVGHRITV
jgi:uncharacterized protein